MESKSAPDYGASQRYLGSDGKDYFSWQGQHGNVNGNINAKKFRGTDFSNATVVDFGAGNGSLLKAITAQRKIAVEVNPHAHEAIEANGIEFVPDLEKLPSGIADFVISNHALEHVPYPIRALQEINRVLKPGGTLLMYLPIDDWRTQKSYTADDINHHLNTWTPQLIGNCLAEAGFSFSPDDLKVVTHAWPPGFAKIYRYPGFDALCKAFAVVARRRQLSVTATKSP